MKKKKKQPSIAAETDHLELFRLIILHLGTTYPKQIFDRRLKLLSEKEYAKYDKRVMDFIDKIYEKFGDEIDDIDEIMAKRAVIENDPWKC